MITHYAPFKGGSSPKMYERSRRHNRRQAFIFKLTLMNSLLNVQCKGKDNMVGHCSKLKSRYVRLATMHMKVDDSMKEAITIAKMTGYIGFWATTYIDYRIERKRHLMVTDVGIAYLRD